MGVVGATLPVAVRQTEVAVSIACAVHFLFVLMIRAVLLWVLYLKPVILGNSQVLPLPSAGAYG